MPDPDEFDQQLRRLTSGEAEPPQFTELSAAERARRSPGPPPPPPKLSRRDARKARELRRPLGEPKPKRSTRAGPRRRKLHSVSSPQRGRSTGSQRRRRVIAFVRVVGILVAFAALLYGLHLLGFGPR